MPSTPTSVKSFVLKFVEVVHLLELNLNADEEDMLAASNAAGGLMRIVGAGAPKLRRTKSEEVVSRGPAMVAQLAAQARVAVAIVAQMKESVLMLDEVDLILHPLKSEHLNWPLGKRKPLDTGRRGGRCPSTSSTPACTRWAEGCPTAGTGTRRRWACSQSCRRPWRQQFERKLLQRTPHLIRPSTCSTTST